MFLSYADASIAKKKGRCLGGGGRVLLAPRGKKIKKKEGENAILYRSKRDDAIQGKIQKKKKTMSPSTRRANLPKGGFDGQRGTASVLSKRRSRSVKKGTTSLLHDSKRAGGGEPEGGGFLLPAVRRLTSYVEGGGKRRGRASPR